MNAPRPPYAATAVHPAWTELPAAVREAVVDWFGEPTRVATAGRGFTGGFAASTVPYPSGVSVPADAEADALAVPFAALDAGQGALVAREVFGLTPTSVTRLDTERDDTFVLYDGSTRHVLKVAHPLDVPDVLDFQVRALLHASDRDPTLPLSRPITSVEGELLPVVTGAEGEPRLARVLTYLPGRMLDYARTDATQRNAVGTAVARLSLALQDFEHPASGRFLEWDLQHLGSLRRLLGFVEDPVARAQAARELAEFDVDTGPALAEVRHQVVHNDVNPDNVVVDAADPAFVSGILDFGDLVHSAVVIDLAVAMSYAVDTDGDPWDGPFDLAAGFESRRTLTALERSILPALVRGRLAQRLVLNSWLASTTPQNSHYTGRSLARTALALRALAATTPPAVEPRSHG